MSYGELESLDRLYNTLDDSSQERRLNATTPAEADFKDDWKSARTELKFCNVPWDEGYTNVVGWESDEQRDEWFDNLQGETVVLDTAWNYRSLEVYKPSLGKYEGEVRVPIPYETALGYNYLTVTAFDQPLPQYGDYQRNRFHYHITGISKLAGNTTVLTLELDAWTEYICSAHIDGMDLERGHWPMTMVDAETWLKNPLDSPVRMGEPEPDLPEVKAKVVGEHWYPLYDKPLVAFACLADLADPSSWWTDGKSHDTPEWWNSDDPNGDAYKPNSQRQMESWGNYPIKTDVGTVGRQQVSDTATAGASPVTPATGLHTDTGVMSSLRFYAVEPSDWPVLQEAFNKRWPQLVYSVKAVFVMPRRFLHTSPPFVLGGVSVMPVASDTAWKSLGTYQVDPEKVGYDAPWRDYAKMYAGQFLTIEISDTHGGITTVSCEDLAGDLEVYSRAAAVWPYLDMRAFVDGVGGRGFKDYKVSPLNEAVGSIPQGLWEQLSMGWDVPTYAVYADNRSNAAMTYAQRRYERDTVNKDYQRAVNAAEVAWHNAVNTTHATMNDALAAADAEYRTGAATNDTVRTNANASADTSLSNALASAATARDNANASASTVLTNSNASAATTQADGNDSAATDERNGTQNFDFTHDSTQRGIDYDKKMKTIEQKYAMQEYAQNSTWLNERNGAVHGYASSSIPAGSGFQMMEHQIKTWQADHQTNNDQGRVSDPSSGSIPKQASMNMGASGTIGDDSGFTVNGSTPGGDVAALAVWTGQLVAQEAMANLQISSRFNWAHQGIDFASGQARGQFNETLDATVSYNQNQNDLTRNNNKAVLERSIANRRTIVSRDYGTATGNNGRSYNTAVGNAARSYNTSTANAQRERDTSVTNANRAHDTQAGNLTTMLSLKQSAAAKENRVGEANLQNEYERSMYEAEQARVMARSAINARLNASYAGAPVEVAHASGDGTVDEYAARGVDIRIRRLSKADEAQVGRTFQRYGYRMPPNTWVSDPKLNIRKRFSYWQARDVWLTPDRMSETAAMFLRRILEGGTTVWNDPDHVLTGGME